MSDLKRGSLWHRWDPHIHAPGTILSDHYPVTDGWEQFLSRIETSDPPVKALGITDYYSTATYEEVLNQKRNGRLQNVELIFPNVELRLGVGTGAGSPVNIHLLVSPDHPDHVALTKSFLSNLEFEALSERYRCTPEDIVRLGRAHDGSIQDDRKALEVGSNQFKVDLANLRAAIRGSKWAQENILIAVAASKGDGTAGLQGDASLARLRREIEAAANIIFSGRPGDRTFWLGQGALSKDDLTREYGGPKPCLHGSDAHRPDRVAQPDQDRRCWLKGGLNFETLRQACLEPEIRVFIGTTAPPGASPSQVISSIKVESAPFLKTPELPLNPGLVGIIGARGSGKTALADFIAVSAQAMSPAQNKYSFIHRAEEHLEGAKAELTWEDDTVSEALLGSLDPSSVSDEPFVRYLSQQFVERLCSAEGLTDELLIEIQRVIFLAHPTEDRLGATDFKQLLDLRAESARLARSHFEGELRALSREFVSEREKKASIEPLKKTLAGLEAQILKTKADQVALVGRSGGSQDRLDAYNKIAAALQSKRSQYEQLDRRKNAIQILASEVARERAQGFAETLRQLKLRHLEAQIPDALWSRFELQYSGDVDDALKTQLDAVSAAMLALAGQSVAIEGHDQNQSFLPDGTALDKLSIALLSAEAKRLEGLIGVDTQAARALTNLNSKIAADEGQAAKLRLQIAAAELAPARLEEIREERRKAYSEVFDALINEQNELIGLYAPLKKRILAESGSAAKLSFTVKRLVDFEAWAERGENLLDLRKGSTLKRGSLSELAQAKLAPAWESGSATDAASALADFRKDYDKALIECCPYAADNPADEANIRQWSGDVSAWLYSADHIQIAYGIQYDGVDVERLSPGTRGIVLLLLYLVIDTDDARPLMIDQPEENLDPKSIFDELVDRFREAKQRRQIIIVTHNANLIVNTDADQVIVATCGPHRQGQLPEISYASGGLEDTGIRRSVCNILEGGEDAFKERAKRLRVTI